MAGKNDLAEVISAQEGISQKMARRIVDTIFCEILDRISYGEDVKIMGFGTFREITRPTRRIKNIQTGEWIDTQERTSIKFKAAKKA